MSYTDAFQAPMGGQIFQSNMEGMFEGRVPCVIYTLYVFMQ